MVLNLFLGIGLWYVKKRIWENFKDAPKTVTLMDNVHIWVGRLIWVLMLVNVGL
jgi:hypothetical protein